MSLNEVGWSSILSSSLVLGSYHCTPLSSRLILNSYHCTPLSSSSMLGSCHCTPLSSSLILGSYHCTPLSSSSMLSTCYCMHHVLLVQGLRAVHVNQCCCTMKGGNTGAHGKLSQCISVRCRDVLPPQRIEPTLCFRAFGTAVPSWVTHRSRSPLALLYINICACLTHGM